MKKRYAAKIERVTKKRSAAKAAKVSAQRDTLQGKKVLCSTAYEPRVAFSPATFVPAALAPAVVVPVVLALMLVAFFACGCTPTEDSNTRVQTNAGYSLACADTLTVASTLSLQPYESELNGAAQGFTVDLMGAIADELGLSCEYLAAASSTENALAHVADTSVDSDKDDSTTNTENTTTKRKIKKIEVDADVVASSLDVSIQLPSTLELSDSYLTLGIGVVALKETGVASLDDLAGQAVAVEKDSTAQTWVTQNIPDATVLTYDTTTEAFTALESQNVAAVVCALTEAKWRTKVAYADAQVIASDSTDEAFAFAVPTDNHALTEAINQALTTLRENGTYDEIYTRWFGPATERGEAGDVRTPEQGAPTYAKR